MKPKENVYIRNVIIYRDKDAINAKEKTEAKKRVDKLKVSLETRIHI